MRPWTDPYREWFDENISTVLSTEKALVNEHYGYAGTMDLHAVHREHGPCVIDFKTQRVGAKGPQFYESFIMQLAAYRECLKPKPKCLSLVINSVEPGPPVEKLWTDDEVQAAWQQFYYANCLFQLRKNYRPKLDVSRDVDKAFDKVTEAAAMVFHVPREEIVGRRRHEPVATARNACYEMLHRRGYGYTENG